MYEPEAKTGARLKRLIVGARAGQPDAVAELARRFQQMISVNCALLLDDSTQTEDVTQDVTEQMLAGIGQLANPEAFTVWLRQIVARTCMRYNKRSRSHQAIEVNVDDSSNSGTARLTERLLADAVADPPEASFERSQTQGILLAHLRQLPPSQRVPLVLRYFADMSYAQIAQLLNVKVGTVSSNIAKGKRNLNRRLVDEL